MRIRIKLLFWSFLIIFFLFGLLCFNEKAEAKPHFCWGISTIGLDQTAQTADVSPGSHGTVEFSGTVTCNLNSATSAIVSLTATDTWNSANVSPSALQFTSSDRGAKSFNVGVKAPLYTGSDFVGTVIVTGKIKYYPSTLQGTVQPQDGVIGRIDIEPYFDFSIYSDNRYIETSPGSVVEFDFKIENQGNSADIFLINVSNNKELKENGIKVSIINPRLEMSEKEIENVSIKVHIPHTSKIIGLNDIKLIITSESYFQDTGESLSEHIEFTVRIHDSYMFYTSEFYIPTSFILILMIIILTLFFSYNKKKRKGIY